MKLNDLEKAALLVKTGFEPSLLEARKRLHKVIMHDDIVSFPQGEEDCTEPYQNGWVGYIYYRETRYTELGERKFAVTQEYRTFYNNTNDRSIEPDSELGLFYHIAPSTGSYEGDLKRIQLSELLNWAQEFTSAAPEAVELLREEIQELTASAVDR